MSEKFQVGQIIEGTVTGIKPFGAFVSLDATTQGLVHISHITHGYLENINDAIKVGDTVKVKILSIDSEKGKISIIVTLSCTNTDIFKRSGRSVRSRKGNHIHDIECQIQTDNVRGNKQED